jgi:hypothetical protein
MPIRRRTLTQAERKEYSVHAEQLRVSGVDLGVSEPWLERNHAFEILVAPPNVSTVCEFRGGKIGYAPFVRLVARSAFTIADCDISTEHDDQIVLESSRQGPLWLLGNAEYRPNEVLNNRIENGLRLTRGQMVEGYILATGLQRIPMQYDGFSLPFEIIFYNQFGDAFQEAGIFSVVRSGARENQGVRLRSGLYGPGSTANAGELSARDKPAEQDLAPMVEEKSSNDKHSEPKGDAYGRSPR